MIEEIEIRKNLFKIERETNIVANIQTLKSRIDVSAPNFTVVVILFIFLSSLKSTIS